MDKIKIAVSGRVATVVDMPEVVADNAEYAVSFAVDPRDGWDMASPITALFVRRDGKYSAVVMAAGETECVMPPARGTTMVFAGLTQDETRTTTPAQIPVRRSVRNLTDFPPLPDKDVYAQILAAFAGIKTISGKGAPTKETKGAVNQIYRDEDTQRLYVCTAAADGVYAWAAVAGSGGGGSVDVDATLTKAGEAADAKAVGDALTKKANTADVENALAEKASKSEIPSVPSWAMATTKPTYTAAEVGALPDTTVIPDVSGKVDKQQGTDNAGKILGIGDDGVVVPTAKPTFTLTDAEKTAIAGQVVADGIEVTEVELPSGGGTKKWVKIADYELTESEDTESPQEIVISKAPDNSNWAGLGIRKILLSGRIKPTTTPSYAYGTFMVNNKSIVIGQNFAIKGENDSWFGCEFELVGDGHFKTKWSNGVGASSYKIGQDGIVINQHKNGVNQPGIDERFTDEEITEIKITVPTDAKIASAKLIIYGVKA